MGRMRPVLAVSDVHLGRATRERSAAFRAFLSYAREAASGLLLAGDIFDFYFEWRSVVMAEHVRVLAALADVVEAGVPVWFLGGNHDSWVGPVLCRDVGLRCLPEPARLVLAGRRCLAVHGDGLDPGDRGYRLLRRLLRHPWAAAGYRWLHPDLGVAIARRVSTTETKVGRPPRAGQVAAVRAWAREQLEADPTLEIVLAGHVHQAVVEEVAPGRYYVNAGDWLTRQPYVAIGPEGPPRLCEWL